MFLYILVLRNIKFCLINLVIYTLLLSFKRHFFPGILFYEGIIILVISTTLLLFYMLIINNSLNDKSHNYYSIIISFFLILTFHTTVITIVDRSISVFIISNVHHGINDPTNIKKRFVDDFSDKGIDKRINEQKEIGNINYEKGELHLTYKGELYYQIFNLLKLVYNTDETIIKSDK
jgi:hypothetical protein